MGELLAKVLPFALVGAISPRSLVRKPKEKPERHEHRPRLWAAYLFGVASMATNFSTLVV